MSTEPIYLVVRADDLGMAQAVNQACIDTYQNGIMTINLPKADEYVGRQIPVDVK